METLTRELVNVHLSDLITVEYDGSAQEYWWIFNRMMTNRDPNWSSKSTFKTHKDAVETGIAYIRHNYPDLVRDATQEALEGIKYRNKQKAL